MAAPSASPPTTPRATAAPGDHSPPASAFIGAESTIGIATAAAKAERPNQLNFDMRSHHMMNSLIALNLSQTILMQPLFDEFTTNGDTIADRAEPVMNK